jgi:luciferase family oxidoreductase group 1
MLRLSVLDQSTVVTGRSPASSIRESLALAKHCEALGYSRYWCAEHHNSASQAGTAPEILISAIAATTTRIRIGSAGIMLPHYSSLKVAEQFRVIEAIAPGRVDLGLGRAPGSDGRTAFALNPLAETAADHFPAQVRDLLAWLKGEKLVDPRHRRATAMPNRARGLDTRQLGLWPAGRSLFRPAVLLRALHH